MSDSKLLIIIPAYNEQGNIERVVDRLIREYPQYDYVVVNDGSKDATGEICRQKGYKMLNLPVNLGLSGAFRTGMKYAYLSGYEYAMQYDADGQHRPEYIEALYHKIEQGYDIVIGSRFIEDKKPFNMRMLGSRMLSAVIHMTTGARIKDPTSGMRMYSQRIIRACATRINYGPEPDTVSLLIRNGAKVAEIPSKMDERICGKSYLNFFRSAIYMFQMMVSILVMQNFRKVEKLEDAGRKEGE